MFHFMNIFHKPKEVVESLSFSIEDMAKLLNTNPETLKTFEEAYEKYALNTKSDNFFEINAKQVAEEQKEKELEESIDEKLLCSLFELEEKIVKELLEQTETYIYDGKIVSKTETWKLQLLQQN